MAKKKAVNTPPKVGRISDPPTQDQKEEEEVKRWRERVALSDRIFKEWEKRFQCSKGWEWYEGYQGSGAHATGDPETDKYIVNLIYPTVEVKIPSLYFRNPKATIVPRPSREDDPITTIKERAKLREDTLGTITGDPSVFFKEHTDLALKNSFFYFGVVEVGYDADWIYNPNANRPIMEDAEELRDGDGTVPEPEELPEHERVYVKHIDPACFRVSPRSTFWLEGCDWSGYFEWVYTEDLKNDPYVEERAKKDLKSGGAYKDDYTGKIPLNDSEASGSGYFSTEMSDIRKGMTLIFKLWDHRSKKRMIFPYHDGNFYVSKPKPYLVFPFAAIKHHERREGWLPMPPHFNWLSPQAEINDVRDKARTHRKRMDRRYQMFKNSIDAGELSKLETGGDGTIIQTNVQPPALIAVEDAPLDRAVYASAPASKEDLMEITATGSDQRQAQANAETATQATVIETRARIRESFAQERIARWIEDIFRKMLMVVERYTTLPYWIMRNVDPLSPTAIMEATRISDVWQQITSDELGELSYDVTVAAESMSPINEDLQNQKLIEVLTMLSGNPILLLMARTSDELLRRILSTIGMRNERTIQQVKLAIEVALLAQTGGQSQGLPSDQGESGQKKGMVGAAAMTQGGPPSAAPGAALPALPAGVNQLRNQMGIPG